MLGVIPSEIDLLEQGGLNCLAQRSFRRLRARRGLRHPFAQARVWASVQGAENFAMVGGVGARAVARGSAAALLVDHGERALR